MNEYILNINNRIINDKPHFLWWYIIAIASTLIFKYFYIDYIYSGGISFTVESYIYNSSYMEYVKIYTLLFLRDFSEVAILLLTFYVIGHKLLRINANVIIIISMIAILMLETANFVSIWNVKSLLSVDALMTTIGWVQSNPDVLSSYVRKRNFAFLFALVCLSFVPTIIYLINKRTGIFHRIHVALSPTIVTIIILSTLLYFMTGLFIRDGAKIFPFKGYWSTTIETIAGSNQKNPLSREIPDQVKLKQNFRNIIYPNSDISSFKQSDILIPKSKIKQRHVLIISLETAPNKYYPITNNPKHPNLYKMSQNAILSDKHFAASPYTAHATYSILTGTYVPHDGIPIKYGPIKSDSLANVLPKDIYSPLYIDSFKLDWHPGEKHRRIVESMGFQKTFERTDYDYKAIEEKTKDPFDFSIYVETRSIDRALQHIKESKESNKKALVFLDSIIGHFKWKSTIADKNIPEEQKLVKIAQQYDILMGRLLDFLAAENLEDDIIVVITGDHGLRYADEYLSLGEKAGDVEIEYNVPFMIYAPGLLASTHELKYVSSHVDITPTLLYLLGENTDNRFYHGEVLLSPSHENRITFMMTHNLKSTNTFHRSGVFYTLNDLTGESLNYVSKSKTVLQNPDAETARLNTALQSQKILDDARENFNDVITLFMRR